MTVAGWDTVITVLLAVLTGAVTFAGFRLSSGALSKQADAAKLAVDAAAYDRARGIYDGAIEQLQAENRSCRDERNSLREQIAALLGERSAWRLERERMIAEITRYGGSWPPGPGNGI